MLRTSLIDEPRERHQLMIEIWAESAHNPSIAAICGRIDAAVRSGLTSMVEAAKRKGAANPDLDADFGSRAFMTVGAGLFKRRVHEHDFDAETEIALALGLIEAVFRGVVRPYTSGRTEESDK